VPKLQKLLRLVIGLAIVGVAYLIYGVVPKSIHENAIFTVVMHFLIAFLGIYVVPLIFTKIEEAINKKKISE